MLAAIHKVVKTIEDRLYSVTVATPLEPFEEARIRLNLRLTWVFCLAGIFYSSTFISDGHYFVAVYGSIISGLLILLPFTIRFGFNDLKQRLYTLTITFFIVVNLWGSGNSTSLPIVLWMVLTVQLTNVILTPRASIGIAFVIIIVYMIKWFTLKNGIVRFPYWIPRTTVEDPRLIDIMAPLFYNLSLAYNSYRFSRWARNQVITSNEKVKTLHKVIADTELRNNLIVEQSLAFISIHDREGTLQFINNAASRALGFSGSELVGKKISNVLHTDVRGRFNTYLEKINHDGSAEGIMRVQRRDGQSLFWFYRNVSIADGEQGDSFLCFAQDVTELEVTRQQLQKARANAEESDRVKSLFIANFSHEFRTPMNAIIGFSELLENPNLTQSKRTIFTRHIRERSVSLLGMLNNLLDFSRLEAGHITLHEIDGNIDELMDKVVVAIAGETIYINKKDIEVRKVNTLPASQHRMRLDYFKLNQVLVNLMSNAIKFTQVGTVLLQCKEESPGILKFSVIDTGEGIQPEKLETIFYPFRQAHDGIQRKYGGSGLGLAICKGLVESWKGKIWVESVPGRGSSFHFTIPWTEGESHSTETGV